MPDTTARPLAAKRDALVRAAGDPSLAAVADAIGRAGGPTISRNDLWLLRTGRKANPTFAHVTAIAAYFGVPPAFFFDDGLAERAEGDLTCPGT